MEGRRGGVLVRWGVIVYEFFDRSKIASEKIHYDLFFCYKSKITQESFLMGSLWLMSSLENSDFFSSGGFWHVVSCKGNWQVCYLGWCVGKPGRMTRDMK